MLVVLFLELRAFIVVPLVFYLQLLDIGNNLLTIATIEIVNMCYLQVVHYLRNQPLNCESCMPQTVSRFYGH